jgi:predicted dehydrogenase
VAQIGTSKYGHGNSIFQAMTEQPDVFEIVGYVMPEHEREKFPGYLALFEGYPEMTLEQVLNDPTIEAVTVETEEIYLTKYAQLAAEHGKHIQMEKPGGESLEAFERLIETVRRQGKVFHTGYMYRYNPVISDTLARARRGELGEIVSVEAQMSGWWEEESTKWLESLQGGMMFYLGCHLIDLVLLFQGEPERIVTFNKSSRCFDTNAKDLCMAVLEYPHGVSFVKTTQRERGGFLRRRLLVTGTKGVVDISPLEASITYPVQYTEYAECLSEDWNALSPRQRHAPHDRFRHLMRAFAEMVAGERENPYSYDHELLLYRTIKKCCE